MRARTIAAADKLFNEDLAGRIFAFESDAARAFSKIAVHRRALARSIRDANAQMAAITQVRRAKLALRNFVDFNDYGIDLVDPWTDS